MKKIVKYITFFIVIIFIAACIISIIEKHFFHNDYPFSYKTGLILSGSMKPTLDIDDFVIVKKARDIKEGDIVLFYDENNKEVMHRVISIDGNSVVTKGDANNTADEPIDISKISGKYVFRIKYLGKIINFIKSPFGIAAIIVIIAIIFFIPKKKKHAKESSINSKIVYILGALLILLIFGVLGFYSKYFSSINGSDTARVASVYLDKPQELTVNINSLKPGTTVRYIFGITNYDINSKTEISMNYSLNVLSYTSIPLTYRLQCIDSTGGTSLYPSKTVITPNTVLSGGELPYGDNTHTYELEISWNSNDNSDNLVGELGIIKILINSTQED